MPDRTDTLEKARLEPRIETLMDPVDALLDRLKALD
jgi:hypothetical protein